MRHKVICWDSIHLIVADWLRKAAPLERRMSKDHQPDLARPVAGWLTDWLVDRDHHANNAQSLRRTIIQNPPLLLRLRFCPREVLAIRSRSRTVFRLIHNKQSATWYGTGPFARVIGTTTDGCRTYVSWCGLLHSEKSHIGRSPRDDEVSETEKSIGSACNVATSGRRIVATLVHCKNDHCMLQGKAVISDPSYFISFLITYYLEWSYYKFGIAV